MPRQTYLKLQPPDVAAAAGTAYDTDNRAMVATVQPHMARPEKQ